MSKNIKVIVKEAGKQPYIRLLSEDSYNEKVSIIGGATLQEVPTHITTTSPNQIIRAIADEDGRMKGLPVNFNIPGVSGPMLGTVVIAKASKVTGKLLTLSKLDIRTICRRFNWELPDENAPTSGIDVIYVPQRGIKRNMTFPDAVEAIKFIHGDETDAYETYELQGMEGIGIIAQDQDETTHSENRLGLKGHFIIIGMERLAPGTPANPHIFRGLTQEEIRALGFSLSLTTFRDMMEGGAEI